MEKIIEAKKAARDRISVTGTLSNVPLIIS